MHDRSACGAREGPTFKLSGGLDAQAACPADCGNYLSSCGVVLLCGCFGGRA
jgi:hypothetical protein